MKKSFIAVLFISLGFIVNPLRAQVYNINTVAGNGAMGYSGDGGPATLAELFIPSTVTVDTIGNLYIADYENCRIRKVTPSGTIKTFAGNGTVGYSGDGGPATAAELFLPTQIFFDKQGNAYISDCYNNVVRKINTNGIITTIAGNGSIGYSGDNGPATAAELYFPYETVTDAMGNLYIADESNNAIRMVNTSGVITTITGNGSPSFSGDGGPASSAEINNPTGVSMDMAGNLYIADLGNDRIRVINTSGTINTVVGSGSIGFSGDGGPATSADLHYPIDVQLDANGNMLIADENNNCIRRVNTSGVITTIAGNGTAGFSGDGGPALAAELNFVAGVTASASGSIYIADQNNNRIRILNDVTGIGEAGLIAGHADFYPVPFTQLLNADILEEYATVNIYNILGELMGTYRLHKGHNTINTATYPAGTYFARAIMGNSFISKRIINVN